MKHYDVAIFGGGPGGSTLGALLAKEGLRVCIFEKEEFPRFHIGESLLPFSLDIFKKTGVIEILDSGKYIRKYGARFVDGLTEEEIYFEFSRGLDADHQYAYEVPRDEFDKDLLQWAKKLGVDIYQPATVLDAEFSDDGVQIKTSVGNFTAGYVADATGRSSLVAQKFGVKRLNPDINNTGVFSHYRGVRRLPGKHEGDITIGLLETGSWCWIIPFKGDITSVGVVGPSSRFRESDRETFIEKSLSCSEILKNDMKNAVRVREVEAISNYSHTSAKFFGKRWILIGDSAAFLDPIFSSGVHLSMSSSVFASEALMKAVQNQCDLETNELGARYEKQVRMGVENFRELVMLFYGDRFVGKMKKALIKPIVGPSFTSALAGDVWNDENRIFGQRLA